MAVVHTQRVDESLRLDEVDLVVKFAKQIIKAKSKNGAITAKRTSQLRKMVEAYRDARTSDCLGHDRARDVAVAGCRRAGLCEESAEQFCEIADTAKCRARRTARVKS